MRRAILGKRLRLIEAWRKYALRCRVFKSQTALNQAVAKCGQIGLDALDDFPDLKQDAFDYLHQAPTEIMGGAARFRSSAVSLLFGLATKGHNVTASCHLGLERLTCTIRTQYVGHGRLIVARSVICDTHTSDHAKSGIEGLSAATRARDHWQRRW